MAAAQALFPPDVSTRGGTQIFTFSTPQGMSSPLALAGFT